MPERESVLVVFQPIREVDGAAADELADHAAQSSVHITLASDRKSFKTK
jgi:hypothetical protein